jgi:hypothetical protein
VGRSQDRLGLQQFPGAWVAAQHVQIAQMLATPNQVVDQPANGLPFTIAPLPHFDPQFFIQQPGHA